MPKSKEIYNFSAGPAALPDAVKQRIQAEWLDYQGLGVSVVEIGHRSVQFEELYQQAVQSFLELLELNADYEVLFVHGGASMQFAMVALNFMHSQKAAYVNTGMWATNAIQEARHYGQIEVVASSEEQNFNQIPNIPKLNQHFDYLHITLNNTIYGTEFHQLPEVQNNLPLIADASSNILSRRLEAQRFSMLYGGMQKNLGVAGIGFAIIHKSLLRPTKTHIPALLDYKSYVKYESRCNTPNTFGIYVTALVLDWIRQTGGVKKLEQQNIQKSELVYAQIDSSDFYTCFVKIGSRSRVNVVFSLPSLELENQFIQQATEQGLLFLKGHRARGGLRASMYNAMPISGAKKLTKFMQAFEQQYG